MEQEERRRTKPEFNGCIRYKRGEYCQPCVAMASNYTYVGIIDRRAVFHQYTNTPSPREQKLAEAARAVIARWESTDWKAAPTADYMNALRDTLSAYDAPGSQGGEKAPIGGHITEVKFISEPPISEEEAVEIMLACTQDHVARGGKAGKACMQLIYRAMAKRLGWM